jgi:hypothetical protein
VEPVVVPAVDYEPESVARASAVVDPVLETPLHRRVEVVMHGPSHGNPFVDVDLSAVFRRGDDEITVGGFYDGSGIYRLRFLPPAPGRWEA